MQKTKYKHPIVLILAVSLIGTGNLFGFVQAAEHEPGQSNQFPHAILEGPIYTFYDEETILDGSDSYDSDGYLIGYQFDYGKGDGWEAWQNESTATISYRTGAFTAKLRVKDNKSAVSLTDTTTVFCNGYSSLQADAHDPPLSIWRINRPIDFNVSVQNLEGDDVYWLDIAVEIYNGLYQHVAWLHSDHFESTSNPISAPTGIRFFNYEDAWQTNNAGLYYIRVRCYDGDSYTWSGYDSFYVFGI